MTLEQMLENVRRKNWSGRGIGLASGYILTVRDAVGSKSFGKHFEKLTGDELSKMLKDAESRFVYRPAGASITAGTKSAKGGVVSFGTPARKDAGKLSDKSIMDFENILTSASKDRDGDILEPKGAKVDPNMPLLWQHMPNDPIGKLVQVLDQSDQQVKTHFAIADCPLGRDATTLIEFGALRISHGFKPLKFEPIEETPDVISGWKVEEYEVMEGSLVSIPANTDAIITAFSRNKLHAPLVKGWAEALYKDRPLVLRGGWGKGGVKTVGGGGAGGRVQVTINLNRGRKARKDAAVGAGAGNSGRTKDPADGDGTGKTDDEDDDEEEEEDKDEEEDTEPADGAGADVGAMAERMTDLANDESLPAEARGRLGTVSAMLAGVQDRIDEAMDAIEDARGKGDHAAMADAASEMSDACQSQMARAVDEILRVCEVDGLDDSVKEEIAGMAEQLHDSLGSADADADTQEGETDSEEDEDGKDDEADPDSESEDNDEGDDSESESGDADDDDDEDEEEKEDDPDNADDDTGNPQDDDEDDADTANDESEADDEADAPDYSDSGDAGDSGDSGDESDNSDESDDDEEDDDKDEPTDEDEEEEEDGEESGGKRLTVDELGQKLAGRVLAGEKLSRPVKSILKQVLASPKPRR